MLVAIDRTSKFAFVELYREAKRRTAGDFLRRLAGAVPYKIHTVLTDNGIHFTTPGAGGSATPLITEALARGEPIWAHAFEYACAQLGIEHRLTKPKHSYEFICKQWTAEPQRFNANPLHQTPGLKHLAGCLGR